MLSECVPLPNIWRTHERSDMRSALFAAAAAVLVLAGCSAQSDSESEALPTPITSSSAPAGPAEVPIALGEVFTISGPSYTADVTIERVFVPGACSGAPDDSVAIQVDVDVKSGDGTREVLNTGTIRERTRDGYIEKERTISRSCGDIDELDAVNVQTGDKYRGVVWLKDDVDPESELLINAPTGGGPITEVFVLNLSDIEIATDAPAPPADDEPTAPTAAAVPTTAAPTVVECLFGTPGPSHMSDGTIQNTEFCANQPGAAESRYLESNCSDMAWRQEMGFEGDRLCGSSLFEDGALGGN